jgi:hypothetical protein
VATYVDSSAIVKLAIREPESLALRRYLRTGRPLVTRRRLGLERHLCVDLGDPDAAVERRQIDGRTGVDPFVQ